ncbi:MAG: ATP phosphoribosyltransferase [Gaiellaceae bacterium]
MSPQPSKVYRRAGDDGSLVVAVPSSGRLARGSLELLEAAGLAFEVNERSLHVPCANAPVELLLVRPRDIPEYIQDGIVDAGITGSNLIAEAQAEVETLLELGFGRCTLEAAVPDEAPQRTLSELGGLRVATAYPVSTRALLVALGIDSELVLLSGSVEAAPRLGLSDAIVDLVSTGTTTAANGLRRIGKLLDSQAVFISSERLPEEHHEALERLTMMLRGVVTARRRRYLMMNAPEERVEELEALLPSMGAPSVVKLATPGQLALHAAVDVEEIWELLPRLKDAGASSILVMPVERVIP